MSLHAELDRGQPTGDRRNAHRRTLRLLAQGSSATMPHIQVIIRDLSLTGLLVETAADFALDECLQIELPEAGEVEARIVWSSGRFFGCKFGRPISTAALSAALLLSSTRRADEPDPVVREAALLELHNLGQRIREMTEKLDRVIIRLIS